MHENHIFLVTEVWDYSQLLAVVTCNPFLYVAFWCELKTIIMKLSVITHFKMNSFSGIYHWKNQNTFPLESVYCKKHTCWPWSTFPLPIQMKDKLNSNFFKTKVYLILTSVGVSKTSRFFKDFGYENKIDWYIVPWLYVCY